MEWRDSVLQPLRYPEDWRDLSHFRPPGTLGTGGTQSVQGPGTLGTGGIQSFQIPTYPGDWRDSVLSGT